MGRRLQPNLLRNFVCFYFCPTCSWPGYCISGCGGGSRKFELWSDQHSWLDFDEDIPTVVKFTHCGHYAWQSELKMLNSMKVYLEWLFYYDMNDRMRLSKPYTESFEYLSFKDRLNRFDACLQQLGKAAKPRHLEKLFMAIFAQPFDDGYVYPLPFSQVEALPAQIDWERALKMLNPQDPVQRLVLLLGWWRRLNDVRRYHLGRNVSSRWKRCVKLLESCLMQFETAESLLSRVELLRQRGNLDAARQIYADLSVKQFAAPAYRYQLLKYLLDQGSTELAWLLPDYSTGQFKIGFGDPEPAIHDMICRK